MAINTAIPTVEPEPSVTYQELFKAQVEEQVAFIDSSITANLSGDSDLFIDVAKYSSKDKPVRRYVMHAAMQEVIKRRGLQQQYDEASIYPLPYEHLDPAVLRDGWMIFVPMDDEKRAWLVFKYRPGDPPAGSNKTEGYKMSLILCRRRKNRSSIQMPIELLERS
jgi:hypothetical protein